MVALASLVVIVTTVTGVMTLPPLSTPSSLLQDNELSPSQLLKAFGLSEPGVRHWHSEPPQYMLDLYNEVADVNGLTRLPGPYGATVVRAFSEKGEGADSVFSFFLTGLKEEEEEVLETEFHVYHSRLPREQRHLLEQNMYMLEVRWLGANEYPVVGRQHIAAHSSGRRVFKLGSGVVRRQSGTRQDTAHVSLQVTPMTLTGRPLSLALHHEPQGSRRPLLVLFSTLVSNTTTESSSLHQELHHQGSVTRRTRRSAAAATLPRGCQRRDMHVNFEAIGWSSWILHPKVYNAYQCHGQCAFPLIQSVNPTNHATVQSFLHHVGRAPGVRPPCCVPSLYGNLTLLFYDSNENVVLKQYDQMVAMQCGCH